MTDTATLDRARQASENHAWGEAFEQYARLADDGALTGDDLERFAVAAWLTAHVKEGIDALERAYTAYVDDGNQRRAAYVAMSLADAYNDRLKPAIGNGWFQRAVRLLDGVPEGAEHGYLELSLARNSLGTGAIEEAVEHATRVVDLGTRFGDRDLQAFGLILQGMVLVEQAQVDRGLALVDEATVAAVAGDLTPITTGIIYCITIDVCRNLADYGRAGDWTEAAARWCERRAVRASRVSAASIAPRSCACVARSRRPRTKLAGRSTSSWTSVSSPAPGRVSTRSVRFGCGSATSTVLKRPSRRRTNSGTTRSPAWRCCTWLAGRRRRLGHRSARRSPTSRCRWLGPGCSPRGSRSRSRRTMSTDALEAAEELRDIAATFDAPALHAAAHHATGAVLTYEGDPTAAITELREAVRHWIEADLPFETAESRRWLALAHRSGGDETSALLELRAAKAAFERLGARLEAEHCDEMIIAGAGRSAGRRVARAFMFTDIVGSTNLLETIGDEAWEDVTRWHNDTLQTLIRSHAGEVVHTTGDGYFAAFPDATTAASCGVAIQRGLAEHRREHGFAPQVRIGLHASEATVIPNDYAGIGVHRAARVGALAEGGEILVTCETVEGEPIPFRVSNERSVSLKGIADPVRVVSIDWRTSPTEG